MLQANIQFRKDYSIADLHREYGTEKQCEEALFRWRWPNGFICSECSSYSYSEREGHERFHCNHCHSKTSLTSGTIFEKSKLSLTTWFLGIHLLTQSETGLSVLDLRKKLNISYANAWKMKHRIMRIIKERDGLVAAKEFIWVNTYDWQYKRCNDDYLSFDFTKLYVPGAKIHRRVSGVG